MPPVKVVATAPVRATEDPERVRRALLALFPDAEVRMEPDSVTAHAASLRRIGELVANHRIPDTARGVMLRGRPDPDSAVTRFTMAKQAAFMGRPAFAPPESALGEIAIEVAAESAIELERAIYEVAPDTTVDAALARVPPALRPPGDLSTND